MSDTDKQYKIFVEWLATPEGQRNPRTLQLLADKLEVTADVLIAFYEDPRLADDLNRQIAMWGLQKVPAYLHALDKKITGTSRPVAKDIKTFMDIIVSLQSKKASANYQQNVIQLSDEQYKRILERESATLVSPNEGKLPGKRSEK